MARGVARYPATPPAMVNGLSVTLDQWEGKVTIFVVWAEKLENCLKSKLRAFQKLSVECGCDKVSKRANYKIYHRKIRAFR